jgi:drug/metabolite transporter, DME family
MLGMGLAILSAIMSAFAVVLVAKHAKESNPLYISFAITMIGLIIMIPLAVVFTDFSNANLEAILLFAASGILAPGFSRLFYYSGLKKLGSSVNASVFSLYPLYGAILAAILLNEVLTAGNWVGIGAIISGIVIIQMGCRDSTCAHSRLKEWGFPIIGGIIFAVSAILSKAALTLFNAPLLGVAIAGIFALTPYILSVRFSKDPKSTFPVRKNLNLFWLAGVGLAAAWILSFMALSLDSVTVVIPLRSTESLFTAFFALFLLRQQEKLSRKLILGLFIVVLGIILVMV